MARLLGHPRRAVRRLTWVASGLIIGIFAGAAIWLFTQVGRLIG